MHSTKFNKKYPELSPIIESISSYDSAVKISYCESHFEDLNKKKIKSYFYILPIFLMFICICVLLNYLDVVYIPFVITMFISLCLFYLYKFVFLDDTLKDRFFKSFIKFSILTILVLCVTLFILLAKTNTEKQCLYLLKHLHINNTNCQKDTYICIEKLKNLSSDEIIDNSFDCFN